MNFLILFNNFYYFQSKFIFFQMTQLSDIDQSIKINCSSNKKSQNEGFNEFINNQPCQRLIDAHLSNIKKNILTPKKNKCKKTQKKSKQQQKYDHIQNTINQVKQLEQQYNQMEIDNNQKRCRLTLHQDIISQILKCKSLSLSKVSNNLQKLKGVDQIKQQDDLQNAQKQNQKQIILEQKHSRTSIENSSKLNQQKQSFQQKELQESKTQQNKNKCKVQQDLQNLEEQLRNSIKINKQDSQLNNNDNDNINTQQKDDKDLQSTNSSNFMSSKNNTFKIQEIQHSLQECNDLLKQLSSVLSRKRCKIGQQLINDQILQQKQSQYCSQISLLQQKIHQMRYVLNNKEDLLVYEQAAKKQNTFQIQSANGTHQYYIDYFLPKKSNIHYRNRQQTQNLFINKILNQYLTLKKQIQIMKSKTIKKNQSLKKNILNQATKDLNFKEQNQIGCQTYRGEKKEDIFKCQLTQRKNVYKQQPANKNTIFHALSDNYQQSLTFKAYSMYKQEQAKKMRLLREYKLLKKQLDEQKVKKKKMVDQYLVNSDIYQYKMKQKMGAFQNRQQEQNQYQMKEILQQICQETEREKTTGTEQNQKILQQLSEKQIAKKQQSIECQKQKQIIKGQYSKILHLQESNTQNQVFQQRSINLPQKKQFYKKKDSHLLLLEQNIQKKNQICKKISTRRKKSSKIRAQQMILKQNEQF